MVKINVLYEMYYSYVSKKLELLKEQEITTKQYIEQSINIFNNHKPTIEKVVGFNVLLKGDQSTLFVNPIHKEEKYLNVLYKNYQKLQIKLLEIESEIRVFKARKIPFSLYRSIIKRYNDCVVSSMLENHSKLHIKGIGIIFVAANADARDRINWGASNKRKNQLITEGKIPFKKEDFIAATKDGITYEGIPWYVMAEKLSIWFKLLINAKAKEALPELKDYAYKPSRGKNSPVVKLNEFKKNLTKEQLLSYTI